MPKRTPRVADIVILLFMAVFIGAPAVWVNVQYAAFAEQHDLSRWSFLPPDLWWLYLTEGGGFLGLFLQAVGFALAFIGVPACAFVVFRIQWRANRDT